MADDFFDDLFSVNEFDDFVMFDMIQEDMRKEQEEQDSLLGDLDDDDTDELFDSDEDKEDGLGGGSLPSTLRRPAGAVKAPEADEPSDDPKPMTLQQYKTIRSDVMSEFRAALLIGGLLVLAPLLFVFFFVMITLGVLDFVAQAIELGLGYLIYRVIRWIVRTEKPFVKRLQEADETFMATASAEDLAAWDKHKRKRTAIIIAIVTVVLAALIALSASCNHGTSGKKSSGSSYRYSTVLRTTYAAARRTTRATTRRTTRATTRATTRTYTRKTTKKAYNDFNVDDCDDPDDFYYWYYDDFADYEDAEDYYYDHGGR